MTDSDGQPGAPRTISSDYTASKLAMWFRILNKSDIPTEARITAAIIVSCVTLKHRSAPRETIMVTAKRWGCQACISPGLRYLQEGGHVRIYGTKNFVMPAFR